MTDRGVLLGELLDLLGYEPLKVVNLTTGLTTAEQPETTSPDSEPIPADQLDRFAERRGRFSIGGVYKKGVIQRIRAMSAEDQAAVRQAGFPRAGIVVVEGVGLLIDDVTRMLIDGRFKVLAFPEVSEATTVARGPAPSKRRGRRQ